jgi:hypothetical protein
MIDELSPEIEQWFVKIPLGTHALAVRSKLRALEKDPGIAMPEDIIEHLQPQQIEELYDGLPTLPAKRLRAAIDALALQSGASIDDNVGTPPEVPSGEQKTEEEEDEYTNSSSSPAPAVPVTYSHFSVDLQPGHLIDRYEILQLIHLSDKSKIFLVLDDTDEKCVLKQVADLAGFENEVACLKEAKVQDPSCTHVVKFLRSFKEGGNFFIVMEAATHQHSGKKNAAYLLQQCFLRSALIC